MTITEQREDSGFAGVPNVVQLNELHRKKKEKKNEFLQHHQHYFLCIVQTSLT